MISLKLLFALSAAAAVDTPAQSNPLGAPGAASNPFAGLGGHSFIH